MSLFLLTWTTLTTKIQSPRLKVRVPRGIQTLPPSVSNSGADSEFIEVENVPCEFLLSVLDAKAKQGWAIDARLYR